MTVGCSKTTNVSINCVLKHITGLVLQTSALNAFPHTIEGFIKVVNEKPSIQQMQCSCKAGLSGICKHVLAVLLFLERFVFCSYFGYIN